MEKGINTLIKETKDNITKAINGGLTIGLPIAVIDLMIDNIMLEIKNSLNKTLQQEQVKYNEYLQTVSEQVEWVDEENE